jgi:hypothetical protein
VKPYETYICTMWSEYRYSVSQRSGTLTTGLQKINSIQFFISSVSSQQLQGQLQTQHSVYTNNHDDYDDNNNNKLICELIYTALLERTPFRTWLLPDVQVRKSECHISHLKEIVKCFACLIFRLLFIYHKLRVFKTTSIKQIITYTLRAYFNLFSQIPNELLTDKCYIYLQEVHPQALTTFLLAVITTSL